MDALISVSVSAWKSLYDISFIGEYIRGRKMAESDQEPNIDAKESLKHFIGFSGITKQMLC